LFVPYKSPGGWLSKGKARSGSFGGDAVSRSDDIPQDVWDAAYEASYTGKMPVVDNVARAILAAKAEEREACAAAAEAEVARTRKRMTETIPDQRMYVDQAWGMCSDTAGIIRDAIRKRVEG
jgi:hypothetical protein